MQLLERTAKLRRTFVTALSEGTTTADPSLLLDIFVTVCGICLLLWNVLLSIMLLGCPGHKAKTLLPEKRCRWSTKPIWVLLDSIFRYTDMDPEFCELLGLSKSELIGRDAGYFMAYGFSDIDQVREQVRLFGRKNGYWLYRRNNGDLLLAQYSIEIRPDKMADMVVTPLGAKTGSENPQRNSE